MSIKNQLKIDYKLTPPPYSHLIQNDNNTTFQNMETPGWTSMAKTEPNAEISNKTASNHEKILDKLNKMHHVDLSNSQFSKIRTKESTNTQQNSGKYDSTLSKSRLNKENVSVHLRSFNQQQKHRRLELTTLPSQSRIDLQNSPSKSTKSLPKRVKTPVIVKNLPKQVDKSMGTKRFNFITVHEHLYLDSKRQQTKRNMNQIFEDQYKKQNTLLFRPSISKRSRQLAENKFSRIQKMQEMESQMIQQLQQLNKRRKSKVRSNFQANSKQTKTKSQYEALHLVFSALSNSSQFITKQKIKQAVNQLPLVFIRLLQKIIEKAYQGNNFTWLQFLSAVNDKKLVSNRQSLLVIAQKWMNRHKKLKIIQKDIIIQCNYSQ